MTEPPAWRRCSACKNPIALGATYWVCSVSTCNQKRTGLAFCTVSCWDAHLPVARHREAWAEERSAPARAEGAESAATGQRRLVRPGGAPAPAAPGADDVLIIASRLKEYIRVKSGGYHTSERVLGPLSEIVRRVCDEAIRNAQREGRRTVLDRDIPES
jgi:hypothetical protein